jgi:hypothetical protein
MKNKILILGIAISGLTFAQKNDQCVAFTTKGTQCKLKVDFKLSNTCHHHMNKIGKTNGDTVWLQVVTDICGENTTKNVPCKNKTKHVSGKCYHHRPRVTK